MRTLKLVLVLALATPVFASATAMSPETSRCYSLTAVHQKSVDWAVSYFKFKNDATLTPQERFYVSYHGAKKIVTLIEEMKTLSQQSRHDSILNESHRLFEAIENNEITTASAQKVLDLGLENLLERMQEVTYRAETKTECQLTMRTPGINPHAKTPDIRPMKAVQ